MSTEAKVLENFKKGRSSQQCQILQRDEVRKMIMVSSFSDFSKSVCICVYTHSFFSSSGD